MKLYDANSTARVSAPFELKAQSTVYVVGMTGADRIEFELCLFEDTPVASTAASGCDDLCGEGGFPTSEPRLIGTAPLTCSCPVAGAIGSRLALLPGMSHVVLDTPQNTTIRAVYTGTNLGDFVVWVGRTEVPNVTPQMRGCC